MRGGTQRRGGGLALMTHRLRSEERGATLVEAVLTFPLLIMLVFGIIAFGRGYNAKVTVTHAAREGVRIMALTKDPVAAETAARNAATGLDMASMTVTVPATCTSGDPVTLTVSYPFTFEIPVFGNNTVNITGDGVMRCGG